MIKILVKAAFLVCIILSIYFIVNPSACSNLMSGRVVNPMEELPTVVPNDKPHSELLTPQGDKTLEPQSVTPASSEVLVPVTSATQEQAVLEVPKTQTAPVQEPVADTNASSKDQAAAQTTSGGFTQADVDYAIASRYVELENEYKAKNKETKNAAKEISYIVMDDFELTPSEWEAFLQRATANNLFEKVRQQTAK